MLTRAFTTWPVVIPVLFIFWVNNVDMRIFGVGPTPGSESDTPGHTLPYHIIIIKTLNTCGWILTLMVSLINIYVYNL